MEQTRKTMGWEAGERGRRDLWIWCFLLVSLVLTRLLFFAIYAVKTGDTTFSGFLGRVNIYDANWYRIIAVSGYEKTATGTATWAFFPLYPLSCRWLSMLAGISVDFAGFLISNICTLIGSFFSYRYICVSGRPFEEAVFYLALMIWGPCGFYEAIFYTEGMYLMFLAMCFYFLYTKQYLLMGISGALCSAVKNTGVFFVFVVLFFCIREWRKENAGAPAKGGEGEKMSPLQAFGAFVTDILLDWKLVLGTMLIPLGMFVHMLYLYLYMGDGLSFVHVQKAFMQDTRPGVVNVVVRAYRLYKDQAWFWAYMIGLLIILVLLLLLERKDEMVWGVINWFVPMQRGLGSIQRYMHICIVVELAFSDVCMKLGRKTRYGILMGAFLAECLLMSMWIDGNGLLV